MSEIQATEGPQGPQADPNAAVDAKGKPKGLPGDVDPNMKISTMAQLKAQAPEVYDKMLESFAQNMLREMRDHQERLKKAMRKMRQQ